MFAEWKSGGCDLAVPQERDLPGELLDHVSDDVIASAKEWVASQGSISTLIFLLRLPEAVAQEIRHQDRLGNDVRHAIAESAYRRMPVVHEALAWAGGNSGLWQGIIEYPYLHACAVRRPKQILLRLLDSKIVKYIAGILFDVATRIPEYSLEARDTVKERRKVDDLFSRMGRSPTDFLNGLGVGNFDSDWGDRGGKSQRICVIDSGVYEEHPALQQKILGHVLFDQMGNSKEAKYAIDRGCHGTKMTGIIAANEVPYQQLGLRKEGSVRLGVAHQASATIVNALQGGCCMERGTMKQLLNGLNWAAENKDHPAWGGYEIVNVSWEIEKPAFTDEVQRGVDTTLLVVMFEKLVPILAIGNGGAAVGTVGTYVGACDTAGNALDDAGDMADLRAPGVDYPSCQPPVPDLGNELVWLHSGSSLGAAFVSGSILALVAATNRSAEDCIHALKATRGENRCISIDRAFEALS
jgi:subtilisin family serine protease